MGLDKNLKFVERPDLNDDDVVSEVIIPGYEN